MAKSASKQREPVAPMGHWQSQGAGPTCRTRPAGIGSGSVGPRCLTPRTSFVAKRTDLRCLPQSVCVRAMCFAQISPRRQAASSPAHTSAKNSTTMHATISGFSNSPPVTSAILGRPDRRQSDLPESQPACPSPRPARVLTHSIEVFIFGERRRPLRNLPVLPGPALRAAGLSHPVLPYSLLAASMSLWRHDG